MSSFLFSSYLLHFNCKFVKQKRASIIETLCETLFCKPKNSITNGIMVFVYIMVPVVLKSVKFVNHCSYY